MNHDNFDIPYIRQVIEEYGIGDPESYQGVDVHKLVFRLYDPGQNSIDNFVRPRHKEPHKCIYTINLGSYKDADNFYKKINNHCYERDGNRYMYLYELDHRCRMLSNLRRPFMVDYMNASDKTIGENRYKIPSQKERQLQAIIEERDEEIRCLKQKLIVQNISNNTIIGDQQLNTELFSRMNSYMMYEYHSLPAQFALQFIPVEYNRPFLDKTINVAFIVPVQNATLMDTINSTIVLIKTEHVKPNKLMFDSCNNKVMVKKMNERETIVTYGNSGIFVLLYYPKYIHMYLK